MKQSLISLGLLAISLRMVVNAAGPIAGYDSIRRYAYKESFYWMQRQVTIDGIGSQTVFTSTNLYSRNINNSWDLMQGGDRSLVDRRVSFAQGIDPLIEKSFGERTDSTKSSFGPWDTTYSQEYKFSTICDNGRSQYSTGSAYQGPGLDTYAGVWQNRNLATGYFRPYNNPNLGYQWNSGFTAFTNTWRQRSFVQLTTGPDRDGDSHSYFWVSATAVDSDTKQSIPVASIKVAGHAQSARGRILMYSTNNAGYLEMLDTTPTADQYPSFTFDEQTERAEKKAGVMAISTIAPNAAWPGRRPVGMVDRLGYKDFDPSDDQILWDILANSPMGSMMLEQAAPYFSIGLEIVTTISRLKGIVPTIVFGKPAGDLSQTTVADRKWITLAFLSRSVNTPPPDVFSTNQVDLFGSGSKSHYRLLNELMVKNVVDGKVNKTFSIRRKRADVGTTRLFLNGTLYIKVAINGKWTNYPISSEWANRTLFELFSRVPNSPGRDNGQITGGAGSSFTKHVTSAHAGWALEPVESMIVQGQRSDFFSRVILNCENDILVPEYELSADRSSINGTGKVWPTAYIYRWDPSVELYRKTITEPQIPTPFDGFMTIDK